MTEPDQPGPRPASREAPPALADELWLIAHDDASGKPRWHPVVAGLGLSAALLGELVLAGALRARAGELDVADDSVRGPLADRVLGQMAVTPQHRATRTWLQWLAEDAPETVVGRLEQAGRVRRETRRRLGRTVEHVIPVDLNDSGWAAARLSVALARQQPMPDDQVMVAGLVTATGLDRFLVVEDKDAAAAHLRAHLAALAPDRRDLLAQAEVAIGNAVLSRRT
jgi:hypothetical protein